MKRFIVCISLFVAGCQHQEQPVKTTANQVVRPTVEQGGEQILYPANAPQLSYYQSEVIGRKAISTNYQAPAHVVASVVSSPGASRALVLFDNPDLTADYSQLQQHLANIRQIQGVNIKQKETELARAQDLAQHGAATGRDVLEAQTELSMAKTDLANERSLLAEHETQLQVAGFNPGSLQNARPGQVWLVCDVPESQVNKMKVGSQCTIQFTAYPDEIITGQIESFGDVVDNVTRTIKLRIRLNNSQGRYRPGMFANVTFGMSEGETLTIPQTSLITVQGKDYVFLTDGNRFSRRPVLIGPQTGERIVVYSGLRPGDRVVTKGAIQLKGLSFGY